MEPGERETRTITDLFERTTGQQLGRERTWRVGTMLKPLCQARGISSLGSLATLLERGTDPGLLADVIDALLNNETSFFRDRLVFGQLAEQVLPRLALSRQRERRLRIWSAACSTGQEAYSLAMMFAEDEARWRGWTIDIVATDISRTAVARARAGIYSQFEMQRGLSVRRLMAWFDQVPEGWRVRSKLAAMVNFGRHNLLGPLPARPAFDLVLCRNVLLYFSPDGQRQVLDRIAGSMASDGALMLGAGEGVNAAAGRFGADPAMLTIFRPRLEAGSIHRAA